jgi:hypothetical protein
MSNIARRLVALEKQAPQAAVPLEDRLARLRLKGGGRLPIASAPQSPGERERVGAKVRVMRERIGLA